MADDEENDDRGPKGGAQDSNVNTGPAMVLQQNALFFFQAYLIALLIRGLFI